MPDIDIDFVDRDRALGLFKHICASRNDNGQLAKHNTGVYMHSVPLDARTNLCAVPYDYAEQEGYFKIDFLNVGIYKGVKDETHLVQLLNKEPLWDLLLDQTFVSLLFHLSNHGEILKKTCPNSVEQLAAVLAMIRPAKRHLIGENWTTIMENIWTKPDSNEFYFKKSHSIAYALSIVVQMNLICEQLSSEHS